MCKLTFKILVCVYFYTHIFAATVQNLNSPQEIETALNALKSEDSDTYDYLIKLKSSNAPDFKQRLNNHYFALLQKREMDAKIPKRELGYREKVKQSDILIKNIQSQLKNADDKTKDDLTVQLNEAAHQRFLIELQRKEKQIEREQKRLDRQKSKLETFKKNKAAYIKRMVTKIVGSAQK